MAWLTGRTHRFRHGRPSGYESSAERLTDWPPIRKKNGEGGLRAEPCEKPYVVACPGRERAGEEIIPGSGREMLRWPASQRKDSRRGPTTTFSDSAGRRRGLRPPALAGCDRPSAGDTAPRPDRPLQALFCSRRPPLPNAPCPHGTARGERPLAGIRSASSPAAIPPRSFPRIEGRGPCIETTPSRTGGSPPSPPPPFSPSPPAPGTARRPIRRPSIAGSRGKGAPP